VAGWVGGRVGGCVGLGVVVVVVVVVVVMSFLTHWQSQSAVPDDVAKENAELSPSSSSKKPLSLANFNGFAEMVPGCETFKTLLNVALSTSIDITLDPDDASSYVNRMTALTPAAFSENVSNFDEIIR